MLSSLLLLACAQPTGLPSGTAVESGWRVDPVEVEPVVRDLTLLLREGHWDLHLQTTGLAGSIYWYIDLQGSSEPHNLVAESWSPDTRIQDWSLELPIDLDYTGSLQTVSRVPYAEGLAHGFHVFGADGALADCAILTLGDDPPAAFADSHGCHVLEAVRGESL